MRCTSGGFIAQLQHGQHKIWLFNMWLIEVYSIVSIHNILYIYIYIVTVYIHSCIHTFVVLTLFICVFVCSMFTRLLSL